MSYPALATAAFLGLFMGGGPILVFVVPTIADGRPLGDLLPVFAFVLVMPAFAYISPLVGAIRGSAELARLLAGVLQAAPEVAAP